MSKKVPENTRLRAREMFFVFLGVATGAALAVLWFRLVPELMQHKGLGVESLSGLGRVVMHPVFEVPVLLGGIVLLAAGVATRVSSGKDKATWIMAAGSVVMFGMLLLSVNAVYDPVFLVGEGDAGPAEVEVGVEE
ncbi:hypothetical protein DB30_02990 [Enhygromyxa salina]|uniref:Uncharacterized protein n=1 Tax=Enhygromyxa salina TaxID=215803 RepID=A0A0C2D7Z1_9BACT|nr:hypothetical protein [Enhygromyxa salina]KIG17715.1 hypothetical protein DB30_02990 [Enhygromyxa salina]